MPTLKCTKCGQESKTGFIPVSKSVGISGVRFWIGRPWPTFPIWPFQTSLVAICPSCKEKTKLIVRVAKKPKLLLLLF